MLMFQKREEKNRQLQAQLEEDINARDEAYRRQYELLQKLDNVCPLYFRLRVTFSADHFHSHSPNSKSYP